MPEEEDATPENQHIYQVDTPGVPSGPWPPASSQMAKLIQQFNAFDYITVRFDGTRPSGKTLDASRCSQKVPWHSFFHVRLELLGFKGNTFGPILMRITIIEPLLGRGISYFGKWTETSHLADDFMKLLYPGNVSWIGCMLLIYSGASCRKHPDAGNESKPNPPESSSVAPTASLQRLGITIPLSAERMEFMTFMAGKLWGRFDLPVEEVKNELERFSARVAEPPEQVAVELMFAVVRPVGSTTNTDNYPLYEITRAYGKEALPYLWNRLERDGFDARFSRKFLGLIDAELGIPETLRQLQERIEKALSPEKRADWQAAYDYLAQFAPK